MYLCPSTGQEENNDKMAFASVERSGQWFVKVPEQKHLFPSTSRICIWGRLGSVLPYADRGFCSGQGSLRTLQGTESLFLSIQRRLLWSLFYKSQVGLTGRPGELLLVNSYVEARRGEGEEAGTHKNRKITYLVLIIGCLERTIITRSYILSGYYLRVFLKPF